MVFIQEQKFRNKIGIYRIKNKETGVSYIGQTRESFEKRFLHHRWLLRAGRHDNTWLQASFNKHGDDAFEFSVVEEVSDLNMLNDLEIFYIAEERKHGKCYNMADGGGGRKGMPLSLKRRAELGELNRILNTGKRASDETRQKMSASRKGMKRDKSVFDKVVKTRSKNFMEGKPAKTAKITAKEAKEIKIAIMNNVSYQDLSEQYGVTYSNINAIRSNRSWKFVEVDGWDEYCRTHKTNRRARQSRSAN